MKRLKVLSLIFLTLPFLSHSAVIAQSAPVQPDLQEMKIEIKELDPRARILRDYLNKHSSPLADHAQDFIDAADLYGIDWKLVPAIAGTESTFGKFVPGGSHPAYTSYNAWGWGVYGTQAIYFNSWKDGIYTLSEGLKKNYIDKGLTEPYSMNRVYAVSPHWAKSVTFFLIDLERFALNYEEYNQAKTGINSKVVEYSNTESKTAGISGKLAYK